MGESDQKYQVLPNKYQQPRTPENHSGNVTSKFLLKWDILKAKSHLTTYLDEEKRWLLKADGEERRKDKGFMKILKE